jgi:hypothetical protein
MIKSVGSIFARFMLCLSLIACLWLEGVVFRTVPQATEEYYFPAVAAVAFLVATYRLYRTHAILTLLIYACSILLIDFADHMWELYGYFDEYKNVKSYHVYLAVASVVIAAISFVYRTDVKPKPVSLILCWLVLVVAMIAIGKHVFISGYGMIGARYIVIVFISLIFAELARQCRNYMLRERRAGAPDG